MDPLTMEAWRTGAAKIPLMKVRMNAVIRWLEEVDPQWRVQTSREIGSGSGDLIHIELGGAGPGQRVGLISGSRLLLRAERLGIPKLPALVTGRMKRAEIHGIVAKTSYMVSLRKMQLTGCGGTPFAGSYKAGRGQGG